MQGGALSRMAPMAGRAVQWRAMGAPLELTSPDNPRVKQVVRLVSRQKERRRTGLLVVESVREARRALDAGLVLRELYVCPALLRAEPGPWPQGVVRYQVSEPLLRKMAYRQNPEGVLAVFEQRRWRLADLASAHHAWPHDLWLIAEGTSKPGNLGAMMRTAEAAGAWGALLAGADVDIYNPNAIRASTGAVFTLPAACADAGAIMEFLEKRKVTLLATAPQGGVPHTEVDMTGPVALAIGAEDRGLGQHWLDAAARGGRLMRIPMFGRSVDSLNASVAAGILLFEAVRQRLAQGQAPRAG